MVFVFSFLLDTIYQVIALKAFYPGRHSSLPSS
jgi:hypothetical protein